LLLRRIGKPENLPQTSKKFIELSKAGLARAARDVKIHPTQA